jgi:hypothetical protein
LLVARPESARSGFPDPAHELEALQRGRYDRAMRRLLTWIVVTLGIAAIARRLRKRGRAEEPAATTAAPDDPADELRQKLAESRGDDPPASEPADAPEAGVEERRADVHEQGRAAVDEMRDSNDT